MRHLSPLLFTAILRELYRSVFTRYVLCLWIIMLGVSQHVFAGFGFQYFNHNWDPCTTGDLSVTFKLEVEHPGSNCFDGLCWLYAGNECRIQIDFYLELVRVSDGVVISGLPMQSAIYTYIGGSPNDQQFIYTFPASTFSGEIPGESYNINARLSNFASSFEGGSSLCADPDYDVLCCNITGFFNPANQFTYDASTCTPCTQTLATIDYFGGFDADFSYTRTGSTTQFTFESDLLTGFPFSGLTRADYYWTLTGPSGWNASGQTLNVPTAANPTPETWTINIPERCGYYTIQYVIDGKDASGAVRCSDTYTQMFCVSQFRRYSCPPCGGGGIESATEEGSPSLDFQVISPAANGSKLHLKLFSAQSTELEIELINLAGQICWQHNGLLARGWTDMPISTTGLEAGIYTLVVRAKNGQQVVKRMLWP